MRVVALASRTALGAGSWVESHGGAMVGLWVIDGKIGKISGNGNFETEIQQNMIHQEN